MSSNFATPLLLSPHMVEEERTYKISQMIDRATATDLWLSGQITTGDFLDILTDQGIDVYDLVRSWVNGTTYL